MATPRDLNLYNSIKERVYKDIPKHSAYRSGILVQKYKSAYLKKYGHSNAYLGTKKNNSGLDRWFKEQWETVDGKKTYSKRGDIFRPTVKVNENTPTTYKELTKKQVGNAIIEKAKTGRVRKYKT